MKNVDVVSVTRIVKCSLSAKDWLLYDDIPGAAAAAERINRAVEAAVAQNNRVAAHEAIVTQLNAEGQFGATDRDTRMVLDAVLEEIYLH